MLIPRDNLMPQLGPYTESNRVKSATISGYDKISVAKVKVVYNGHKDDELIALKLNEEGSRILLTVNPIFHPGSQLDMVAREVLIPVSQDFDPEFVTIKDCRHDEVKWLRQQNPEEKPCVLY